MYAHDHDVTVCGNLVNYDDGASVVETVARLAGDRMVALDESVRLEWVARE
ncbi:hypothetical protein [Mycobacterium lepromatosis]|uniref:hypothetical protein n=1 Tax=Mycobacterium lepromatosis TaxID=480418 RepID=UPI000AA9C59E|nr:hypothetical protein [Mycobacterium lepromatosis]